MAEVILMPRLSDTMTEGVIAAWHKNVGETINKGDLLADIETDKATMELESYQSGVLLHIGTEKGGKLQVNDLLCIIGKAGEDISSLLGATATATASAPVDEAPVSTPAAVTETPVTTNTVDISSLEEVVLMPRLSDTMTEGVIAAWHKNIGDTVKKGEVLAEIETDKATMELESYKDGTLLHQGAAVGSKILVNDLLCVIGKPDFDVQSVVAALANGGGAKVAAASPATPAPTTTAAPAAAPQATPAPEAVVNEGRILASPLAKVFAKENNIDLKYVKGTADNGRIVKSDVENYKASGASVSAPATASSTSTTAAATITTTATEAFTEVPVSQMRKVIAKRLSESLFTAPHFYLTMSINMDNAIEARTKLNATGNSKISFNDMVVKATALSLTKHPAINSSWLGDKIRYNQHVNIGIAVAVEDGLLVPVVRNANTLSFSQIGSTVKDYAQKAKDKKLQPSDWEGNTFTISNLGMFGIEEFTAIINPPDACILAVGGINQVPVVKNGQIVPGNIMKVTLSCDHRVVDGATGAAFLQTLKGYLEEPLTMLM